MLLKQKYHERNKGSNRLQTKILSEGKFSTTAFPAKNPLPRGQYVTIPIPSSLLIKGIVNSFHGSMSDKCRELEAASMQGIHNLVNYSVAYTTIR